MEPIDDDVVLDLLERWEEARTTGTVISVEDLCRDHPTLVAVIRSKIAALKASDWMRPDRPFGPRVLAGRYRLERLVGQGGYGQVWLAFDEELQRPVAVKVPKATRRLGERQIDQLLTEARHVARLRHPGIVTVHDVLKEGAGYVIVSDFIEGEDLAERLRRGPLPVADAVKIVAQVARILDYGHGQGIVHRDIKPSNVLLDREGGIHVCDFGIAATQEEMLERRDRRATLAYASPEQLGDGPVDHRTDLWSLGVVLHEMLAGRRPFEADDPVELRQRILAGEPPGLASVPEAIVGVCRRCLSRRPEDRFARGNDLANTLEGAVLKPPSRRWGRWVGAGLACLLMSTVLLGWALWPTPEVPGTVPPPENGASPPPGRDDARRVLRGHAGVVRSVALTPDGDLVGSGGDDGTLRLWGDGQDEPVTLAHDGPLAALAFGDDGRCVLTGTGKGTVTLWCLPPRTVKDRVVAELGIFPVPLWSPWPVVAALVPRPDRPWPVRTFPTQVGPVKAVAVSGDGRFVAWAGKDKLEVWESAGSQPLTVANTPGETVHSLAFLRDGQLSAAFGYAGGQQKLTTRGWILMKVKERWVASPRPAGLNLELFNGVRGFVVAADGATVLVTQADAVRVFTRDEAGFGLLLSGAFESPKVPLMMTAPLPGGRAVSVGQDRAVRLWNTALSRELAVLHGHAGTITALAVSQDGGTTATASEDGSVRLWRTPSFDREMADRVLEIGGVVTVEQSGGTTTVTERAEVPGGNFRLIEVDLSRAGKVTDEDVDRLQSLAALRSLKLPDLDSEFLLGTTFAGVSNDANRNGFRVTAINGAEFTGDHFVYDAEGGVKHHVRVSGTIRHGQIRYAYEKADIVKDGGFPLCRYAGTITRNRLKLTWELVVGNLKGSISLTPTAKD